MLHAYHQKEVLEAGCDEVGRGALAGPVVAAAVVWPADLQSTYIQDSKKLSPARRDRVELYICARAVDWAIGQASVEEIDQHNIEKASYLAMHRAVAKLSQRPGLLLIDGCRFKSYPGAAHRCFVRGDALYTSIAAASVIAKRHRDRHMRTLSHAYPAYGWDQNVGYPTAAHRWAMAQHGVTAHHRNTFAVS